jgi:hypothetical protein
MPVTASTADQASPPHTPDPEIRPALALPEAVAHMRAQYLEKLGALQLEFANATNPELAAKLQTQIRLAKLGFEEEFLSYQLARAEATGLLKGQSELKASLEAVRALMHGTEPGAAPVEPQEDNR